MGIPRIAEHDAQVQKCKAGMITYGCTLLYIYGLVIHGCTLFAQFYGCTKHMHNILQCVFNQNTNTNTYKSFSILLHIHIQYNKVLKWLLYTSIQLICNYIAVCVPHLSSLQQYTLYDRKMARLHSIQTNACEKQQAIILCLKPHAVQIMKHFIDKLTLLWSTYQ